MRRLSIAVAGLALVLGGASALADSPAASLQNAVCHHAVHPADRAIAIQAVMRHVAGTRRMALRFDLLERDPGQSSFRTVLYGTWIHPANPTLGQQPGDTWDYTQRDSDLQPAPATYRFRVHFRWTGSSGQVIERTVLLGPTCWQPELRPDLYVGSVSVSATPYSGRDKYVVSIGNRGRTRAGEFQVSFADGSAFKQKWVYGLAANTTTTLSFVGPACTSTSGPTITADPQYRVDDYDRANNSLTVYC